MLTYPGERLGSKGVSRCERITLSLKGFDTQMLKIKKLKFFRRKKVLDEEEGEGLGVDERKKGGGSIRKKPRSKVSIQRESGKN